VKVSQVSESDPLSSNIRAELEESFDGEEEAGKSSFLAKHDKKEKGEKCAELSGLLILGDVFIFLCLPPPQLFLMSAI